MLYRNGWLRAANRCHSTTRMPGPNPPKKQHEDVRQRVIACCEMEIEMRKKETQHIIWEWCCDWVRKKGGSDQEDRVEDTVCGNSVFGMALWVHQYKS